MILLSITPETREMLELVSSLGYAVSEVIAQNRSAPDPVTYFGSGRIREVIDVVLARNGTATPPRPPKDKARAKGRRTLGRSDAKERARRQRETPPAPAAPSPSADGEGAVGAPPAKRVDAVVVNGDLKPSQLYWLESRFKVRVLDRLQVILEIFKERASSPEARLQVELARLHYEMPVVKEFIHAGKAGERPGFLAGGEYGVESYYQTIHRRMAAIRRDLARIRKERGIARAHRRREGADLVSLSGYTNAGKSALLNRLTGAHVLVEERYFSTLATSTKRVAGTRRDILLTDTVGFIEGLPPWLVDAFRSTLEEITLSDAILLVVDAAEPYEEIVRKLTTSQRILSEFERLAPLLLALNKVDLLDAAARKTLVERLERDHRLPEAGHALLSALTGEGVEALMGLIYAVIPRYEAGWAEFPRQSPETERAVAWLHEHAAVLDEERASHVRMRVELKQALLKEARRVVTAGGGTLSIDVA